MVYTLEEVLQSVRSHADVHKAVVTAREAALRAEEDKEMDQDHREHFWEVYDCALYVRDISWESIQRKFAL